MPNNSKRSLTIVIVSFNSGNIILNTLGDLIKSSGRDVIIVDNASTDNSVILLNNQFPDVKLISLSTNIGYGRAANIAFKQVKTKYGLLINPDVLLSKSLLETIYSRAIKSNKDVAVFSPALKEDSFYKQGDMFVEYLVGAFLLFRMSALKDVGFFDENIFLFYEEKDIELRFIQQGYKLALLSDIFVEHIGSASTASNSNVVFLRNWHVAWSKYYYSYKHDIFLSRARGYLLLLKYGLKALINKGHKRIKYRARYLGAKAYMKGEKSFVEAGHGKYSDNL